MHFGQWTPILSFHQSCVLRFVYLYYHFKSQKDVLRISNNKDTLIAINIKRSETSLYFRFQYQYHHHHSFPRVS